MKVKIKDIVRMTDFQGTRIISGVKGNENPVENVNIMEVPDIIKYTRKNALLFTTLFPIKDDLEALKDFIPSLSENQLAGVAIKLGRYIQEVPDYMIKQSNKLNFPILILPEDADFSILTNKILVELLGMKTSILEFREYITDQFQQLLLSTSDIKEFVELTSKNIKADVLILKSDLEIIESSNDLLKEKYQEKKSEFIFAEDYVYNKEEMISRNLKRLYMRETIDVQAIVASERILGYMVIICGKTQLSERKYRVVMEQSMILLAFLFQSQKNIKQNQKAYLDSFIRDIINEKNIVEKEVVGKAEIFNWKLTFPMQMMSVRINSENTDKRLMIYQKILESNTLEKIILEPFPITSQNIQTVFFNGELLIFISLRNCADKKRKLKKIADRSINYFKKEVNLQISFSNLVEGLSSLSEEYQKLQLVHDIYGEGVHSSSYTIFYDELGIIKFFHAIEDKQVMVGYVKEKIGKILEEDERKDSELLNTLDVLIKNNMNIKKSSEELYIHNNSLRYRMDLIKKLGIDLDNGHRLAETAIAIQMHDYLKTIS